MNNGGFVKGLIIGGIVGASVSMMLNSNSRSKKGIMRNGNNFIRKSGRVVNDVIDLFR
jgi:gas vesicle protein